ncbi:MAG: cytidine deaminase [Christensenellales bacterium]
MITYEELLKAAEKAKENAYAPYSRFRVGAALLAKSGKVYTGANVESASYSVSCCAERSALYAAVSSGETAFLAIAVTSDSKRVTYPCGICRQALCEFSPGMDVISANNDLKYETKTLDSLLPHAFSGKEMEK